MKDIAIVSSFSESCGNAFFTEVLVRSIENFSPFSVEGVELDLTLTQSTNGRMRQLADEHIDDLCVRLKHYRAVNIQFEAGLFGSLPVDIRRRMAKLVRANPNTSVTLHSPRLSAGNPADVRASINLALRFRFRAAIAETLKTFKKSIHERINYAVIRSAINAGTTLIVHTGRSKRTISSLFPKAKILLHPLKFVDQAARDARPGQAFIQRFKDGLGLSQDDIVIGILGYVSAYKGHLDAIKALQLLPPNYKLMIFGRQHPQTIKNSGEIDAYMGLLLKWIFKLKIKDRVFFMGELPEAEFLDIAEQLDVTILPYYENGQDGSGIASICMDMSKKVVCSTSFAFDELFKLISYKNVYRFDIGNYLDLAQKILAASRSDRQVTRERSEYSIQSQAQLYIKSFGLPSVVPDPKLVATATAERVS